MWLRALRFVVALIVAAILWYNLTPLYDRLLAAAATPLIKIDSRLRVIQLDADDRIIKVTGNMPAADIPAGELTYNVILLVALFASNRRPLRGRNVRAFLVSMLIVAALHVVAVLLSVESTYAVRMGSWSAEHYGAAGHYFWLYAEIFYRLVGMFGAVFVCWWASMDRP